MDGSSTIREVGARGTTTTAVVGRNYRKLYRHRQLGRYQRQSESGVRSSPSTFSKTPGVPRLSHVLYLHYYCDT